MTRAQIKKLESIIGRTEMLQNCLRRDDIAARDTLARQRTHFLGFCVRRTSDARPSLLVPARAGLILPVPLFILQTGARKLAE